MDLFGNEINQPLADRLRPKILSEFMGQKHLLSEGKILHRAIKANKLMSMILWGPPGVGKTTLANIIANETVSLFYSLSAVAAGVADVRNVIAEAEKNKLSGHRSILFIDEIHRFNKSQQDALLHSVEDGTIILIGATTENPSFEVIAALLSRCRIFKLEALNEEELNEILHHALSTDKDIKELGIVLEQQVQSLILKLAGGDARHLLTTLEIAAHLTPVNDDNKRVITRKIIEEALQRPNLLYDKSGDYHYDIISAFIKSVRGSDPDAAIYWLARMLEAGEDIQFIARRLVILASEDIGNADPHALMVATSAFHAITFIGMPEARIVLAQATTYLASAPKSNASYLAVQAAQEDIMNKNTPDEVPLHLRNAPTRLMSDFGYAAGYQYPHDHNGFIEQNYFPAGSTEKVYYHPTESGVEKKIKERLQILWPKRKR